MQGDCYQSEEHDWTVPASQTMRCLASAELVAAVTAAAAVDSVLAATSTRNNVIYTLVRIKSESRNKIL